ncbi:Hydrophobic protein like, partial [Quillaja saponaria]
SVAPNLLCFAHSLENPSTLKSFSLQIFSCTKQNLISWKLVKMADESGTGGSSKATFIDILVAIILPPLGVFLKFGCKAEFWISLLLTILGYIPGIIYAVYIITK